MLKSSETNLFAIVILRTTSLINFQATTHIQQKKNQATNKMAMIANVSFKEGQISYIEWSNSMTQVQSIKMQALETLELFNLNQSTLNYLLSK